MGIPSILIGEKCALSNFNELPLGFVLEKHLFKVSGNNVNFCEYDRDCRVIERLSLVNGDREFYVNKNNIS